ncbi:ABC transporter ATP-binding protein [Myxacorys almedinensis]|uniref:ATP-binding cassette domain-containing protein n=1 Tax=Myxacorys almedinensis A TaxID=2690445 RepID=A0A8J7YWH8_9CYAN|nr:ABC transporter ATP-binding protein [Myxacorys almedinensis]NDJ15922.1 ATP-binding cassette domain-containing protein [Myxacorys almedinensis A]
MDKKLELVDLRKQFNAKVVPVKNVSLSVGSGEFLTLLGPSGCGKSTILRLIAGLEQPTSGQVLINGKDVSRLSPGDRNIAMVFQSYALYPHMTVRENIASGLKLRKTPSGEIQTRIQDVTDFLGLHDLMDRKPGQLSGGQRQRVAVARTLVRRPDVFLLDEPLSNLDALLREHVRAELKQLFGTQNTPVVYVTHDQTEAMTLSTRVAVLNNGYLQQLDAPERIYMEPANRFVAGFIGSPQMNFLQVPCESRRAIVGNHPIPLPRGANMPTEITLGIRPEHVHLAQSDHEPALDGQVFLIENLGMHNLVSVRIQGQGEPITVRAIVGIEHRLAIDSTVRLAFPPESIHWFDVSTGDRIQTASDSTSVVSPSVTPTSVTS